MITKIGYELTGKGLSFPETGPYESQNVSDEGLSTFWIASSRAWFCKIVWLPR